MKALDKALELKSAGKLEEAKETLISLTKEHPDNSLINYHCACCHDSLGLEADAVPYYEKAISLGLPEFELQGAFLGLGSTYRTLGKYAQAKKVFENGQYKFPDNRALQIFYSMTLYNLRNYSKAMELLLKNIAETSNDENIKSYKMAIEFYSDKLDTIW